MVQGRNSSFTFGIFLEVVDIEPEGSQKGGLTMKNKRRTFAEGRLGRTGPFPSASRKGRCVT